MNMNKEFEKLDSDFKKLVKDEKLDINSIENLMLENLEKYKSKLKTHIEELLTKEINENEIISKKNKNGKKKDLD